MAQHSSSSIFDTHIKMIKVWSTNHPDVVRCIRYEAWSTVEGEEMHLGWYTTFKSAQEAIQRHQGTPKGFK